jgi:nitrogen fixation protein FixH
VSGGGGRRGGGGWWIVGVIALLAGNTAAVGVLIRASRSGTSHHVVPDYYARAVRWDDEMTQARTNRALGWTVTLDLARRPDGALGFAVAVLDRDGVAVRGASVSIAAFHRARAGDRREARLVETAAGYRADLALPGAGIYEVEVIVEAGERRWADVLVREVGQ